MKKLPYWQDKTVYFHLIFCLLLVLTPFFSRWWSILPVGLSCVFVICFFCTKIKNRASDFDFKTLGIQSVFLFAAAAMAYISASYFWSVVPDYTLKRISKLWILAAAGAVLYASIRHKNHFWGAAPARLYFFSFAAGIALLCFEALSDLQITKYFSPADKVRGSDINPGAAAFSVLIWPILFLAVKKLNIKAAAFGAYLLTCGVLFLTDSQSSQLAMVVAGLIFAGVYFFRQRALKIYFFLISISLFAAPFLYPVLRMSWPTSINDHVRDATLVRLDIWAEFSHLSLNAPFFGHGAGASRYAELDPSRQIYNVYYETVLHPHSAILQIWYELGLMGIFFLWGGLGYIFFKLIKAHNRLDQAFTAAMITAMGAVALVGYGVWQSWLIGCYMMVAILFVKWLKFSNNPADL